MLFDPVNKKGTCKKLKKRRIGPYFITAEGYGYTYKLRRRDDGQDLRAFVNSNRLRPFNELRDLFYARNPPSTSTDTSSTQISTNTSDTRTPDTGLGDGWYEINSYQPPNDGRKTPLPSSLEGWESDENVSDYAKAEYYARCQAKRKPKRRMRRT